MTESELPAIEASSNVRTMLFLFRVSHDGYCVTGNSNLYRQTETIYDPCASDRSVGLHDMSSIRL